MMNSILKMFIGFVLVVMAGCGACSKDSGAAPAPPAYSRTVMYDKTLNGNESFPELQLNGGQYTSEGLSITSNSATAKLNIFYALAERMALYRVKLSADAKARFYSSTGDFNVYVDMPDKSVSIATNPVTLAKVGFLQADREYRIEIYHAYQVAKVRIVDSQSGESAEISATCDGSGGVGKGALQAGFNVGMQYDHYCFSLVEGSSMMVKQIAVYALKDKVKILIYGDSVTQPEGYFPTRNFPQAWTQRIINRLDGNAMSSGRGGCTIKEVLEYIKNELPFVKTEYVMVTIGTNGGNTEANLSELIEYIKSQGAIPVLNNIPCNESGTQVENNALIDLVRHKYGVKGCRFDLATSLDGDGREVDKSMMYWEDYTGSYGWQVYHHPNEKGGQKMYERTFVDIPEIYE
jgi:hypothetical protein